MRQQRGLRFGLGAVALLFICGLSACGSDYHTVPGQPAAETSAPLKVMTFNVLCSFCDPTYDRWPQRLEYFADIFARHDPDLVGLQEVSPPPLGVGDEVASLNALLPGHAPLYFNQPELGALPFPDGTIFYRTSRFTVLENGYYWLSPTPDEPFSTGFAHPQLPRVVNWVRLFDMARDREIYFATTHFDNNSPSQQLSAPLVQERSALFAQHLPVIVVGDFNSRPNSTAYGILTTDAARGFVFLNAYDLAAVRDIVTNQTPAPEYDVNDRIDHIFLAGPVRWRVPQWFADLSVYGPKNRYPSDHFPIVAEIDYD